ncbi:hypothetical protein OFL98_26340, partial [Escherichia coli]|nr:hypothetical protein [Escherichia coli]
ITAIDSGGSFTSLTIFYNKRSDGVVLLLPIAIDSGARRLENSIYNPLAEISVYNNPKAIFIAKTSDKMDKDNEILKKFFVKANKFINYNIILTEDYY